MRTLNFLSVILLSLVIGTSCSQDTDLEMKSGNEALFTNDVDVVTISGTKSMSGNNQVLRFKDEATFQRITQRLDNMPTSERVAFADSLGFITLTKLMKEADLELEVLAETSVNKVEFDEKYKAYKNKYSMFLYNDVDSSDLSPYFPLKNNLVANFVNENAQIMIGNHSVNNETVASYHEKMNSSGISTYAKVMPKNDAMGKTSNRKVSLHLSMEQYRVVTNFTCQKHTIFGWVRYSTIYIADFFIKNFQWVKYVPMSGGTPGHYISINTNNKTFRYQSVEQDGNYTFSLGNILGGSPWYAVGDAKVWSRGVPEENAGSCTIDLVGM